jgi:hypothetical protein
MTGNDKATPLGLAYLLADNPGLRNPRFAPVASPWAGFFSALRASGPVDGLFTQFGDAVLRNHPRNLATETPEAVARRALAPSLTIWRQPRHRQLG